MVRVQVATVLFASVASLTSPSPQAQVQGERYRDPAGRFSVMIPTGWNATPQAGGVVIANGTSTAAFSPFNGATSGRDVVSAITNQYGSQWRDLQRVDQGDFLIAGRPAAYAVFTGINPRGSASMLRIAGVTDNREAYAVIMSSPRNEFNAASVVLQAIEQSFTIGSGAATVDGASSRAPQQGGGLLGIRGTIGLNGLPIDAAGPMPPTSMPPGSNVSPANRVILGVVTRDVEDADLPRIGINERLGAFIVQIAPGSAAERARLLPGDLILSADKQTIRQHAEFQRIVQSHRPGDTVDVIVMRQGKPLTMRVLLR